MSKTSRYVDLIGKQIDVENPSMGTRWRGKAIAYADKPTLLVELSDGSRLMLPAEWASEAPPLTRDELIEQLRKLPRGASLSYSPEVYELLFGVKP